MTSVAYPAKPPVPGWMQTAWALLSGWIVAGLALWVLYFVGSFARPIDRTRRRLCSTTPHGFR